MNDVKDKEKLARCIEDFEEKDDADSAIKRKKVKLNIGSYKFTFTYL